jgi:hypothetical protein
MGNAQALDDGDVVVGWGSEPYITEFAPGGGIRFEAKLPHGGQNYRAFRLPWTGHPAARPKLALRRSGGIVYAYATWNGATEVASWRLLAGNRPTHLTAVATKPKQGFETTLTQVQGYRYFAVAALDRHGKVLGRSSAVRP